MLLPPMYRWSFGQFVDSWAFLIESLGLLALVVVSDRGLRWLPLWIGAMLALSITRDATDDPRLAAAWLTVMQYAIELPIAATPGYWAAEPSRLCRHCCGGAGTENLAYILAGYNVPPIRAGATSSPVIRLSSGRPCTANLTYPLEHGTAGLLLYGVVAVSLAAIVLVARASRPRRRLLADGTRGDPRLRRPALVANNPQGYRLELVFVR